MKLKCNAEGEAYIVVKMQDCRTYHVTFEGLDYLQRRGMVEGKNIPFKIFKKIRDKGLLYTKGGPCTGGVSVDALFAGYKQRAVFVVKELCGDGPNTTFDAFQIKLRSLFRFSSISIAELFDEHFFEYVLHGGRLRGLHVAIDREGGQLAIEYLCSIAKNVIERIGHANADFEHAAIINVLYRDYLDDVRFYVDNSHNRDPSRPGKILSAKQVKCGARLEGDSYYKEKQDRRLSIFQHRISAFVVTCRECGVKSIRPYYIFEKFRNKSLRDVIQILGRRACSKCKNKLYSVHIQENKD